MLPADLVESLSAALATRVLSASPVSGGMINRAARVETSDGPVFVKWPEAGSGRLPGLYGAEADGLERLRAAPGGLRVPGVLALSDDPAAAATPFLALEYVAAEAPAAFQEAFTRRFVEGLARQHRSRPGNSRYGLDRDNYLGSEPQANGWAGDWPTFYAERRLLPQIDAIRDRRRPEVTPERERLLMGVVERLGDLLDGMPPEASLLHGDLWSGNFLHAAGDEPVLVDPAAYYGPREMEVAYVELFGGFPPGFVALYRELYPLAPGYERRRPLHQLWHLLVHWNLFGEPYGARCEEVCRLYAS